MAAGQTVHSITLSIDRRRSDQPAIRSVSDDAAVLTNGPSVLSHRSHIALQYHSRLHCLSNIYTTPQSLSRHLCSTVPTLFVTSAPVAMRRSLFIVLVVFVLLALLAPTPANADMESRGQPSHSPLLPSKDCLSPTHPLTCVCMYVCMHACMCVCVCVCVPLQ